MHCLAPSGAGKSTLIKAMLSMTKLEGKVHLPQQKYPIAYVPQDDAVHLSLTVMQALDYACQLRCKVLSKLNSLKYIEAIAKEVGLNERLDLRIKSLSGGQRKRVSVALEMLTKPTFMILDEPTSGLDPGMEAQLMQLFASIAKQYKILFFHRKDKQSLWYMELENSLRKVKGDKDKKF
ncbi:MAG: ATP-binding cassette domain-containing protein [Mariprofundaceae bacterium]|nr:ATP-binding cassette domain-containing protein [Mariprofundaceae bacterium]